MRRALQVVRAGEGSPGAGDDTPGAREEVAGGILGVGDDEEEDDITLLMAMGEELSEEQLNRSLQEWGQTPTGHPPPHSSPRWNIM